MNRFERTIARAVSPATHGKCARVRVRALAESALTRLMSPLDPRSENSTDTQEPQDDRPGLVAHDLTSVSDGPLTAFYDPKGGATDGQIIYARATIDVGDWI